MRLVRNRIMINVLLYFIYMLSSKKIHKLDRLQNTKRKRKQYSYSLFECLNAKTVIEYRHDITSYSYFVYCISYESLSGSWNTFFLRQKIVRFLFSQHKKPLNIKLFLILPHFVLYTYISIAFAFPQ